MTIAEIFLLLGMIVFPTFCCAPDGSFDSFIIYNKEPFLAFR